MQNQTPSSAKDPEVNLLITNPTGNFNASGTISSILIGNIQAGQKDYVLSGEWNLLVSDGNITSFEANFTMVSVDGADRHTHLITNFTSNAVIPVILDRHGTVFTGMTDVLTDGNLGWPSVQTTVNIAKHDTIKITMHEEHVEGHFYGQPIYGIMFSLLDNS